jgi:AI-2 transport protein TqsA
VSRAGGGLTTIDAMMTTAREVLPRGLQLMLGAAAAVIVFAGLRAVDEIVGPAFLALVLTVLLHPVRGWLSSKHWPGWLASLVCILSVYAILIGLAVALVVATGRFATLLPTYQDRFNELVDDLFSKLNEFGVGDRQIQTFLDSLDLSKLSDVLTGVIGGMVALVSSLVFICMLVLFMTFDASTFPAHLAAAAGERPTIVSSFRSFASGTRTYLLVSTVFGLIVAVLDTIALAVMGVPVPVLWGLLAFITNYIPNVGFVIGLIPPAVLGLLEGGPGLMLAVIVVYCVINLILQSVIQPKFVGDAVGLSTSITFLSLVFWAFILGALGALLAIPLTLLVKAILVDADPRNAWLQPLLSNRSDPDQVEQPAATPLTGPATTPTA